MNTAVTDADLPRFFSESPLQRGTAVRGFQNTCMKSVMLRSTVQLRYPKLSTVSESSSLRCLYGGIVLPVLHLRSRFHLSTLVLFSQSLPK